MFSEAQRKMVIGILVAMLVLGGLLSETLRPGHNEYMRAGTTVTVGDTREAEASKNWLTQTSFQALLPTVLGVREVLASLMWVRADSYFHSGEYKPIFEMVRQIVAIDPHQLDVYATGAWHMAYNFMDKRLIEDGVAFLEDGCRNNSSVYDLFFELGYMHYDKTKNFPEAVKAYEEAANKQTTTGKKLAPAYVRHQLAHAKEKGGDIDACIEQWRKNLELTKVLTEEGYQDFGPMSTNTSAARHNLYISQRRVNERLAGEAERRRDAKTALALWQKNVDLANDWLRETPGHKDVQKDLGVAQRQVARLQAGNLRPTEVVKVDMPFTVTRIAPRKLQIKGKINVLDLSRVHIRFEDKDYATRSQGGVIFKMDNCSREWENPSVRKGEFTWTLDLDRDPADMGRAPSDIYPLKAEEYELSVTFNPRLQAAFIQDRYGWNGEGLTAAPGELVIDESRSGRINGQTIPLRMVRKTITLKREDLVGTSKVQLYPRP